MVVNAVEAVVDVAGGSPRMANVFGPVPRLVIAPFAQREQYRSPRRAQSFAHREIGSLGLQAIGVAPVVLQVVDSPLRVAERVLILIAAAAGFAATGFPARIGVDAELQAPGMDV